MAPIWPAFCPTGPWRYDIQMNAHQAQLGTRGPRGITSPASRELLKRTWRAASSQHASLNAAGIAFFGVWALFPALAALVSLGGILFGRSEVAHLLSRVRIDLPESFGVVVVGQLEAIASPPARYLERHAYRWSRHGAVELHARHARTDRGTKFHLWRGRETNVLASAGADICIHVFRRGFSVNSPRVDPGASVMDCWRQRAYVCFRRGISVASSDRDADGHVVGTVSIWPVTTGGAMAMGKFGRSGEYHHLGRGFNALLLLRVAVHPR